MAANLHSLGITSLGKPFLYQIISYGAFPNSAYSGIVAGRRTVRISMYDKNLEEHVQPSIVPDEEIIQGQLANYCVPHPQTGVFGLAIDQNAGGERGFHSSPAFAGEDSSLEQKAFFRPLENLDKLLQP